jgi:hypothetical protein
MAILVLPIRQQPTDRGSFFAPIGAAGNDPLPPTLVDTSRVFESFTDS